MNYAELMERLDDEWNERQKEAWKKYAEIEETATTRLQIAATEMLRYFACSPDLYPAEQELVDEIVAALADDLEEHEFTAADEREACAEICEELAYFDAGDSAEAMRRCAAAIRARLQE
jgi:hypothetical protein